MKKSAKTRSVLPLGTPAWWDEPAPLAPEMRGEQLEQLAQELEKCDVSIPESAASPRKTAASTESGTIFESIGDGCYRTAPKPSAD